MQQPPPTPAPRPALLPTSNVLSYVASIDSPTRVRLIASRSLRILGWISLLLFLVGMIAGVWLFNEYYIHATGGALFGASASPHSSAYTVAPRTTIIRWVIRFFDRHYPLGYLLIALMVNAITQLTVASAVYRGRKIACVLGILTLPLPMLGSLLTTMVSVGAIILLLTSRQNVESFSRLHILWLIPTALVALLLLMLLKDLADFLLWINRNPLTEKMPVKFLS